MFRLDVRVRSHEWRVGPRNGCGFAPRGSIHVQEERTNPRRPLHISRLRDDDVRLHAILSLNPFEAVAIRRGQRCRSVQCRAHYSLRLCV
jgi:hypothetical protein